MIERGDEHRGAQVRYSRRDRNAGRLRLCGSGHREPADVALRRVRIVRGSRARGVRGLRRTRLVAYLALAAVGAAFITLGTFCSRDAWLAAGATGAVGFVTLFSGAFNGYLAAASTGAILLFVLPANIPAPNSAIPDRLFGFALAAGVGTAASLFLWPPRRRADFRRSVAAATRSVVELIEAEPTQAGARADAARAAVDGLRRSFLGSHHRPAGPTNATGALAALPDELDWLLSFLEPPLEIASPEEAEAMSSAASALRASIDRLEGGSAQADFDRLERARDDVARGFIRRLPELPPTADAAVLPETLETPFRVRAATYSARQVGLYAMRATAGKVPSDEETHVPAPTWGSVEAAEQLALEHASVRSVWLQNSVRGAVALAVSVFIAQSLSLQHGFWVVLGTLSVLRSNALSTGWSIVSALGGTAVGIVVGALLVIVIGTHHAVLWAVLPLAVLLAAFLAARRRRSPPQRSRQRVRAERRLRRCDDAGARPGRRLERDGACRTRGGCRPPPSRRRVPPVPRRAFGNSDECRGRRRARRRRRARAPRGTVSRRVREHDRPRTARPLRRVHRGRTQHTARVVCRLR